MKKGQRLDCSLLYKNFLCMPITLVHLQHVIERYIQREEIDLLCSSDFL